MSKSLIAGIRKRLDHHRRYQKGLAEINALTVRDLCDMGGDRTEMEWHLYHDIYGQDALTQLSSGQRLGLAASLQRMAGRVFSIVSQSRAYSHVSESVAQRGDPAEHVADRESRLVLH